jgi:hypothetical protein
MTPYVDSRDGRSLSLYGSECQIWKTFTTICTAIDVETGIVTHISYHHYLKIVGNNKL